MKKPAILFLIFLLYSFLLTAQKQVICKEYSPKYTANTLLKIQQYQTTPYARSSSKIKYIQAYVRFHPDANIQKLCESYDIKINVGDNNLYTALIPIKNLEAIAQDHHILEIDTGQEIHLMMDSVRIFTHIDEAYNGTNGLNTPYRGKNVLIGIIDAGLDFGHPNFRDNNGKCRIQAVWDQNNFFSATNSPYGYGIVYNTPEDVANAKRDMELSGDTHGTHVTGIAAGSYDGPYRGVAPEADIVLVSTNKTEQGIMDGIDFLLKYAENAKKPISINLSIGTVLGYKDGTDNFSVLIDQLLKGQKGKLLSIAAGNEGDRKSTLAGIFGDKQMTKSYWIPPSYGRDNLFIQGEKGHIYQLTITLKNTTTHSTLFSQTFTSGEAWSKSFEKFGTGENNDALINISSSTNNVNGNPNFRITMSYTQPENEIWEITFSSESGKYMINSDYGYFTSKGEEEYTEGTTDYTIACTATGYEPIAVGAYVSRQCYQDLDGNKHIAEWKQQELYPLSGKGPTYDNRIKPDVVAPGATVISSFSSYAESFSVKPEYKVFQITDESSNRKYSWGIANGTSMATPVVTGTLALWLEINPKLTAEDVKKIIKNTAYHDTYTGEADNGRFGMGKLDAIAGLKYLQQETSVQTSLKPTIQYSYNRNDNRIQLFCEDRIQKVCIYTLTGVLYQQISFPNNSFYTNLQPGNIYLLKIITDKSNTIFKIIP